MHSYDEFSSSQPHSLLGTPSLIATLLGHAPFSLHVLVLCRPTEVKYNFLPEQRLEALYWSRENSATVNTVEESDSPSPTTVDFQASISRGGISWGEMTGPSLSSHASWDSWFMN